MLLTSKNANKMLKQLNEELNSLNRKEELSKTFVASINEDKENVRPEYNYKATQIAQKEIEEKVIKIKHALNMFNVNTVVPEFNMTIDEMLIYIPQLSNRKAKLAIMKDTPKLERVTSFRGSNIIDYTYTNYDLEKVSEDYNVVTEELTKAQIALDKVNMSLTFEVDI